jgi:AraC family L-rhamnose operon regulatory protein RhaS
MAQKPSYRTTRNRYEIDHCDPQREAIQSGKIDFHALTKGHYPGTAVPKNILPGLSSIGFWDAGGTQDWGLNAHRNEGIEIMFLETGTMPFTVDHASFKLRAGNFTVTRPWQLHKLGAPNIGPGRLHWLILDVGVRRPHQDWHWPKWMVLTKSDLKELTKKLRHNETPVWIASPAITASFHKISHTIAAWHEPYSVSRLAVDLNHLLIGILDVLNEQKADEYDELVSHQRTVELFLKDLESGQINPSEPWTLRTMADHCHMGITTFSKYCRQIVNLGPVSYLNHCRLDQAARLLRNNPDQTITSIAMECGYNSSQYFATAFNGRFKTTPSGYRRPRL